MIQGPSPAFMDDRGQGPHSFFFDFDSTLYPGESLEELLTLASAQAPDRDALVRALEDLGRQGMDGDLPFESSLQRRLKIVRLHRRHIAAWVDDAEHRIVESWRSLLRDLAGAGHRLVVISGGFRLCIEPLVAPLGIGARDVHCNEFLFDDNDWVRGADPSQPLSRSGGKATIVRSLVASGSVPGLRIMVGDGATDVEAVGPGACHGILGYGAYASRQTVRDHADTFFENAADFDLFLRAHFL